METGAHCVTWETLKVKLVPDEAARACTAVTTIKSTQASWNLLAMLSYEERKPGAARVKNRLRCSSLMVSTLPNSWQPSENRALSLSFRRSHGFQSARTNLKWLPWYRFQHEAILAGSQREIMMNDLVSEDEAVRSCSFRAKMHVLQQSLLGTSPVAPSRPVVHHGSPAIRRDRLTSAFSSSHKIFCYCLRRLIRNGSILEQSLKAGIPCCPSHDLKILEITKGPQSSSHIM